MTEITVEIPDELKGEPLPKTKDVYLWLKEFEAGNRVYEYMDVKHIPRKDK